MDNLTVKEKAIAECRQQGYTYAKIAEIMGCNWKTVAATAQEATRKNPELNILDRKGGVKSLTAREEEVVKYRQQGYTYKEIAEKMGCSQEAALATAQRAAIKKPELNIFKLKSKDNIK